MKKLFAFIVLLSVLLISACSITPSSPNTDNNKENFENESFDTTYQHLLKEFSDNDYRYSELEVKSFDNNEELISGVIYLSDDEFDICRVKIRTFNNKISQVYLNYDISGDEKSYDKYPDIVNTVAHTLKPELPDNYIKDLDNLSDDQYSEDYQDLRTTLTFSEKYLGEGMTGTAIDCIFVHLDHVD